MAPTLYMVPYSEPVRAVLMTIKAIDLDVQLIEVDLFNKQQLSPEYTKLNPQHSVPTLVEEDGFVLWDSHAIMQYLIENYAKNHPLYPNNPRKRGIIAQRLHFETGHLFPATKVLFRAVMYQGAKVVPKDAIPVAIECYKLLETFLQGNKYVCGTSLTIADFSIVSSITTLDILVPIDANEFPNIAAWLKRIEAEPCNVPNRIGLMQLRKLVEEKLKT